MKKCFKCNQVKSLHGFYVHAGMADGRLNKCKECSKKDIRNYRTDNPERISVYERKRFQRPERKMQQYLSSLKRDPIKKLAKNACSNAIRDGRLIRKKCEVCERLFKVIKCYLALLQTS